ncbi:chemokine XC receptor 1-like [Acipenser ruthenus]|uniref:chemokine XC receptor 1-like n=1 Tax=Acipenser ruthenus TaxID=7906 RepID=UPI001561299C|nr:chemokine XC receptor 1-like [Acipenser ruthenus]
MGEGAGTYNYTGDYAEDTDYEDESCNKEDVQNFGAIVTPILYTLVIVLSLIGNLLVLWILVKCENLKSITNIFTLNLAVSDLLFTFSLPFWAFTYTYRYGWVFGGDMCKVIQATFYGGFYSGILFLTMMTIHRYIAVVHPLYDLGSRKSCYGITATVVIWLVSILAVVPVIYFNEVKAEQSDSNVMTCDYHTHPWKQIGAYQQNVFFLVAFSVIIYCYFRILQKLLQSKTHKRYRTVKLIFSIVVVFFFGWAPFNVVIFLRTLVHFDIQYFTDCTVSKHLDYALYICRKIAFFHCCLNPVFYAFMGVKFRNHLKTLLQKCWFYKNTEEQPMTPTRVRFSFHGEGSIY